MAVGSLGRAAMTPAIMSNYAITVLKEKQHLRIPIVRRERPSMVEDDRLAVAPILVIDLCSIFCSDERHGPSSCLLGGVRLLLSSRRRRQARSQQMPRELRLRRLACLDERQ